MRVLRTSEYGTRKKPINTNASRTRNCQLTRGVSRQCPALQRLLNEREHKRGTETDRGRPNGVASTWIASADDTALTSASVARFCRTWARSDASLKACSASATHTDD